jgi:hypothetical protein
MKTALILPASLELDELEIKTFQYKDDTYMKIIPCKRLFNSTTVHEVVTRGDFFAVNLRTGIFTVVPQGADKK